MPEPARTSVSSPRKRQGRGAHLGTPKSHPRGSIISTHSIDLIRDVILLLERKVRDQVLSAEQPQIQLTVVSSSSEGRR